MSADLQGRHILVTSGPTRADIDAVRYVANRSSGRLGCRIACEALGRGARVTLVAGPDSVLPRPEDLQADAVARLRVVHVDTVQSVMQAMERELRAADGPDTVVHAMAVLDYAPAEALETKTPSGRPEWTLKLVRTPKVIRHIRDWRPGVFLVQFKLEVTVTDEQLREIALASMARNRADMVVANDMSRITADAHPALILAADGSELARPGTKAQIASSLCDILAARGRPT